MKITVGCDPEVFLINKAGEFISSIGKIGGSKDMPKDIGRGCAIQEDNVAVEFNTPPAESVEDFLESIDYNLKFLSFMAEDLNLQLSIKPSANFSKKELSHPMALQFGCEPDFNAWNGGQMNPKPRATDKSLRSAGGHIHIGGIGDFSKEAKITVVKAMDLFVGSQMVLFDQDVDRRKLYGKAGAFRWKPYGVEYRTASNAWLISKEKQEWVFKETQRAVDFVEASNEIDDELGGMIQECINTSNAKLALELRARIQ